MDQRSARETSQGVSLGPISTGLRIEGAVLADAIRATFAKPPLQTNTNSGHGILIEAYKDGDSAAFEDVIIHMVEAENLDGCTDSDVPEVGWSTVAMWIIEDNDDP